MLLPRRDHFSLRMVVLRFCLSFRDVQEMMFERGVVVSHEAIRLGTLKFGAEYARRLRRCAARHGDTWYLNEVVCKINGELVYLWRAVDQEGDTLEVLVQKRRNAKAARRFLHRLLKRARSRSASDRHRRAIELRGSVQRGSAGGRTPQRRTVEQSSRELAST